ncbi:MAG: DM13 domain-containing protein [Chitinophagaceae bacterium]|nr:DM13 domain-containing protein [Chitinophagaceae bacterium]
MKKAGKLVSFVFISVWLMACSKESSLTEVPATDNIDTTSGAVKYSGSFMSAPGERATGTALILLKNGIYSIALKNMNVSGGPDLRVYLSKQIQPIDFFDLGKLKSTNGDQVYQLANNIDFTTYKYALIFCKQFNKLFGSAELK